jgi:hypothetical protein
MAPGSRTISENPAEVKNIPATAVNANPHFSCSLTALHPHADVICMSRCLLGILISEVDGETPNSLCGQLAACLTSLGGGGGIGKQMLITGRKVLNNCGGVCHAAQQVLPLKL